MLVSILLSGCSKVGEFSEYFTKEKKVQNKEADRKLYDAIQRDDIEGIDQALIEGADINDLSASAVDGRYTNPVAIALFEGQNRQLAKYLLEKGADPDQEIQYGVTVLTYCTMNDLYDLAKYMLENGADPNIKDDVNNFTALDYAAQNISETRNVIEMMDLLISYGAKPSKKTVALLLTNTDKIDETEVFSCVRERYNAANYLVRKMSEDNIDTGLDPSLEAAMKGDSKLLLQYLKKDKVKDRNKNVVLEYATAFGNKDVLSYMFDHGYDYEYRTPDLSTLLMVAAFGNNVETMSYLYELGIEVNDTNNYPMQVGIENSKQTALHNAVRQQSHDAVKWLLEHGAIIGAGVDIKDKNHYYANELWELSHNSDIELLKLFVEYGYYISENDAQAMIDTAGGLPSRGHSNPNYDEFVSYVNSVVSKDN